MAVTRGARVERGSIALTTLAVIVRSRASQSARARVVLGFRWDAASQQLTPRTLTTGPTGSGDPIPMSARPVTIDRRPMRCRRLLGHAVFRALRVLGADESSPNSGAGPRSRTLTTARSRTDPMRTFQGVEVLPGTGTAG